MKLLMVSAEWCGPCKLMKPIAESVTNDLGMDFEKVDVEDSEFQVSSVPTFILLDDENNEVRRTVGLTPAPQFKKFLEEE